MNYGRAALGGVAGGLIGAIIWAAIVYFANLEVGYVAWAVGGLVGLGVRLFAGEQFGVNFGIIAAVIALLALILGKFAAVELLFRNVDTSITVKTTAQDMLVEMSGDVVREQQAKGKRINFPPGIDLDKASKQTDYPPDIWREAQKRWNAIPPAEQTKMMADRDREFQNLLDGLKGEIRKKAFASSFGPFDLLWFGLAMFTAFRLGSGAISSD